MSIKTSSTLKYNTINSNMLFKNNIFFRFTHLKHIYIYIKKILAKIFEYRFDI